MELKCKICSKSFTASSKHTKTCSKECLSKLKSLQLQARIEEAGAKLAQAKCNECNAVEDKTLYLRQLTIATENVKQLRASCEELEQVCKELKERCSTCNYKQDVIKLQDLHSFLIEKLNAKDAILRKYEQQSALQKFINKYFYNFNIR